MRVTVVNVPAFKAQVDTDDKQTKIYFNGYEVTLHLI